MQLIIAYLGRLAAGGAGILALTLTACGGTMPKHLGVTDGRLAPCPDAPRCVSSDSDDPQRRVAPLSFGGAPQAAWRTAVNIVEALPRTTVVSRTDEYLHAECRSAVFRFVDDLELHLRPDRGEIAIRSSSRVGYYDFGVNRRRVESIRSSLEEKGVVR